MAEVIVEIGPGGLPVYLLSEDVSSKLKNGGIYLGINLKRENLKTIAEEKIGYAIEGDLRKLPLGNNSADEIWLLNVFSGLINTPDKLPDGALRFTLGANRYFEELSRVIKPHGEIHIGEYYVPEGGKGSLEWMFEADYKGFFGLEKTLYRNESIKDFFKLHSMEFMSSIFEEMSYKNPFFITLKKP